MMCGLMMFAMTANAQKRITKITFADGSNCSLFYNQDGNPSKISEENFDEYTHKVSYTADLNYEYSTDKIVANATFNEDGNGGTATRTSNIANGLITDEVLKVSYNNASDPYTDTMNYEYDSQKQLVKYTQKGTSDPEMVYSINWKDGNIVSGTIKKNGNDVATFTCEYDDKVSTSDFGAFEFPAFSFIMYEVNPPLAQSMAGYYGKTCKNHLLKFTYTTLTGYENDFDNINQTVETDADGYEIKMNDLEDEMTSVITWGEISGISSAISSSDKSVKAYYNMNGMLTERPAKGLNIVKYTDGTTRKVVIK
jgi:hypothetical protein